MNRCLSLTWTQPTNSVLLVLPFCVRAGSQEYTNSKMEIALTLTNRFEVPETDDTSVKTLFVRYAAPNVSSTLARMQISAANPTTIMLAVCCSGLGVHSLLSQEAIFA